MLIAIEPNGLFLLGVGLASFAVVCVAAAFLLLKAWRLFKRGLKVSAGAAPLAAGLAAQADQLGHMSEDMIHQAEKISLHLERLQASLRRLQILVEAWRDAATPYMRVREYLGR